MKATWRWFGPSDRVSISDVRQAGATGVVTALHHVPDGTVWSVEEIRKRQQDVEQTADGSPSGLAWEVVESLPVSEAIKQQKGDWRAHVEAYKTSLRHLAGCGIQVVCYNFMPVLDWTRTELKWRLASGVTCMRFDLTDFVVFDVHLVGRAAAREAFPEAVLAAAERRFAGMADAERARLAANITCGLPGAASVPSLDDVKALLAQYDGISAERLRAHFVAFLEEVVPVAEELGLRLCCHPDDPPFPLLGLPRIMSTEADCRAVLAAVDSPANGVTLCSGSLGVRSDNDLPGMMERLGPRVHFLHLRNVQSDPGLTADETRRLHSFHESEHLSGNTDMIALIAAVGREEARRRAECRADAEIPMRPDHGQDMLDDLNRDAQPGYPTIGRMKGLAELLAVERTLARVGTL
ncbi:mannonate dehydratase [Polymorphum gilvum]|uniref:Mannonate dehydratase n=1 Tax=Polymorphum gilvum (strain LMG 25793 / CGMCC 1.9160 / SL003B-26A1) TaxID=991905 RepID=F2J2K6_POLGS|nr:mannonate dehydratase [Polymorphum gilvum]ADZ70920.1 Mannonate dehydratase 1 [Polymorphum gilvum SL003B-26A1]